MYTISFKESARKELYALPVVEIRKVSKVVDKLAENPRPKGFRKLKGKEAGFFRVRSGDYRIVYAIFDSLHIVNIRRIGHRKDIYD